MRLQQYLNDNIELDDVSAVTYELYCGALDEACFGTLEEGFFDKLKSAALPSKLISIFKDLKDSLAGLASEFGVGLKEIVIAFKQKDVFRVLKGFGFNLKVMLKAINACTKAFKSGLLSVFEEIVKTGVIQKLRSGAIKVDDFLNKYPKLKKIGGIVVAGLLLYLWLNMTFIGDFDYDFDFTDLGLALQGSFSIADLFLSPSGLMLLTLFGTGSFLGLSMPWLGKSLYNLIVAVAYTGFNKLKGKKIVPPNMLVKLKQGIMRRKV